MRRQKLVHAERSFYMFNMENIGLKISELRKSNNMTQMELADKMNISFQAVSNWERGNSMPDISKLPELAQLFGVTIDEILEEKSELLNAVVNDNMEEYLDNNCVTSEQVMIPLFILLKKVMNMFIQESRSNL